MLLDYGMPGLDGMATLRRMKDDPELRQIPVAMLTGVNARETVKEVIMAGAAGFIVKPGNRSTILARIRNLLPKTSENAKWE
ncbi:MAG: response regulator [Rhodocyclaceae bacterium]|nr:response regulator [Rhodocyclaceae bacterium]